MTDIIGFLVYEMVLRLAKVKLKTKKTHSNVALLVKTDELGDYILFRNYLPQLIAHFKRANTQLVFVGNALWKDLFESYDNDPAIISCIWINKKQFNSSMRYRFGILRQLRSIPFTVACNLVVSRNRRVDDALMAAADCKDRLGYADDFCNMTRLEHFFNRRLYKNVVTTPAVCHDFLKHPYFIATLTHTQTPAPALALPVTNNIIATPLPANYVVLFPGSGKKDKIWATEKFVTVAIFLKETYGYHICLAGSAADAVYADEFKKKIDSGVTDFCGKTNFRQLIELVQKSQLVVSIDTGSVHVAAACNKPCFAIFNGIHWGRFAPYPAILQKKVVALYPPSVEAQTANAIITDPQQVVPGNFNDVSAGQMINAIRSFMGK